MGVLTTIPRDDNKGAGGISYVLLANYGVNTPTESNGSITTFDVSAGFTKFVPTKETSNWNEAGTGNPQSGTSFWTQTLTMGFRRNQVLKRNAIKVMATSGLVAIAVDRNGEAWGLGFDNGLDLTGSTQETGTAPGDTNGATIVLTGNEKYPALYCTSTALAYVNAAL